VVIFEDNSYGILDFKTTNLSDTKSENYKYQLEAYAQIFTYPGKSKSKKTPKLEPIIYLGILQFFPYKIFSHLNYKAHLEMEMSYSPLKRDIEDFYRHITFVLDILSLDKEPEFNTDCNKCNFVITQSV